MKGYEELPGRLEEVRERIGEACRRVGRDPGAVEIVVVTKTHPPEAVRAVLAAGLRDVGENKVQELDAKVAEVGREAAVWHLIGHLQRNKVRRATELADLIHSIDSVRLARKLSDDASAAGRRVAGLIQVNLSGEDTKGGLEGAGMVEEIVEISELPGLRIVGLMTMAPFTEEERVVRPVFERARLLAEAAASASDSFEPKHLSMGMSGDYEVAVEEGSTLVRLGTVLLGERGG